jgi:hypothetical protein
VGETRNARRILVEKHLEELPLLRLRRRLEDNIKIVLKKRSVDGSTSGSCSVADF